MKEVLKMDQTLDQKKIDRIMEKIGSGREYRRMEIRVKAEEEQKEKRVEGYACTFNEPYELYNRGDYIVREQIDPAAFNEADMSDVIMQYDHQGRVFARNSNGTLELSTDEHGLHMEADLSGTEIGRQLYEEIKGGYTTKMSFGFTVEEDKREITENRELNRIEVLRTITKVRKLYDVSAVSLPANDGTEISARSWADGVISQLEAERLQSIAIQEARTKALAAINKYHKEVPND
jgi:HK97 family phage prohead protease